MNLLKRRQFIHQTTLASLAGGAFLAQSLGRRRDAEAQDDDGPGMRQHRCLGQPAGSHRACGAAWIRVGGGRWRIPGFALGRPGGGAEGLHESQRDRIWRGGAAGGVSPGCGSLQRGTQGLAQIRRRPPTGRGGPRLDLAHAVPRHAALPPEFPPACCPPARVWLKRSRNTAFVWGWNMSARKHPGPASDIPSFTRWPK